MAARAASEDEDRDEAERVRRGGSLVGSDWLVVVGIVMGFILGLIMGEMDGRLKR